MLLLLVVNGGSGCRGIRMATYSWCSSGVGGTRCQRFDALSGEIVATMCLVLHSTRRHHASSRCPQRCWLFAYSAEACTLTIHVCFPPLQAEGAFADAHCVRDRAPLGYARPHVPPTTLTHQCAKPTARWSAHSRALSACMTVHHDTSDHLCAPLTGTGGGC